MIFECFINFFIKAFLVTNTYWNGKLIKINTNKEYIMCSWLLPLKLHFKYIIMNGEYNTCIYKSNIPNNPTYPSDF